MLLLAALAADSIARSKDRIAKGAEAAAVICNLPTDRFQHVFPLTFAPKYKIDDVNVGRKGYVPRL